ncbi:MAG: cupin domain-containing protein [Candidatus Baltobacteraceae bacterium]
MQPTVIDGVAMWSRWQPERNLFFNSYFVFGSNENVLVDPLPLDDRDAEEIAALGGAAWIVVTNRDHERAAGDAAARFGAKVAASEPDACEMALTVDRIVRHGDAIGEARVIGLEGLKTPGEFALYLPERETAIVGDALWGAPAGSLRMMPDEKLADPDRAARSLRRLRAFHPRHCLVGDGAPVFHRAYDAITEALESRAGAHVNAVNLDELLWLESPGPGAYSCELAEIGFLVGAEHLGYRIARLRPGEAFCPTHWHTAEEELFIVWEGAPTLETPHGAKALRRGDLIAFPTRPFGAHKLVNRSDAPATVILVANTDPHDVCFYPDSKKLLVEATDTLVRAEPILDYYDGEV